MSVADALLRGIESLDLTLPDGAETRLLEFLALLVKWNRTYNLTAVREEADIVTHHLLDSLTLVPALTGVTTLADVGSGGGLPAIPIALACPMIRITSLEAVQKKAAFQQQVRIELKIPNLTVRCARVENEKGQFDAVTSRALASLADFVSLAGQLVRPEGLLLAMKGIYPAEEIAALPQDWRVENCHELRVPGLDASRHLVVIRRK